ncbi:hypothetical protein N801_17095 [Knoellia aerolata DSM 18566]|uniref:PglD N-terminal domain-containing protein n=2 Tax=Knoellia TaxID=136099 RepID=A0A0A0K223_9MICO|nr:hypothetical protein N801_17095 [Knoellia aerolata DSM 18566]
MGVRPIGGIVVVGAGGFGREVVALIQALGARGARVSVMGVVDDLLSAVNRERLERLNVPFLGPVSALAGPRDGLSVVVGVGAGSVRETLVDRLIRIAPDV